jgi:hypothetical protein
MSRLCPGVRALQAAFAALWIGLVVLHVLPSSSRSAVLSRPRALAAYQGDNRLLIALRVTPDPERPTIASVELLGPDGELFQKVSRTVPAGRKPSRVRFAFAAPKLAPAVVTVSCRDGRNAEAPLSDLLVAKGHETSLFASPELVAGSHAALRCSVHAVRSLSESILLDASVKLRLVVAG